MDGTLWGIVSSRPWGQPQLLATGAAMIADAFEKERLGFGLGVNQIAGASGLVLGPVVGGILAPLGWQWIFLMERTLWVVRNGLGDSSAQRAEERPQEPDLRLGGKRHLLYRHIFPIARALPSYLSLWLVRDIVNILLIVALVGINPFLCNKVESKTPDDGPQAVPEQGVRCGKFYQLPQRTDV